ncbi:MAG: type 1 glutamine amidotransferase [Nitrospirae bacterium]|nr:type 1 glutamine amidotransferase [Nitrospirota bacterium]
MSVLILKNISSEGPGSIGVFLREDSIPYRVVEFGEGESPSSLDGFDTLVMLGGPMAVYEMDEHSHLMAGSRLLREAINREMRVLGICLGAQMIAHCLGAMVYKGHAPELGWLPIELTGDALKDPLMRRLAQHPTVGDFWRRFKVFHWHGDTFELPIGSVRLASSGLYPNQAFRYGKNVYAFQFHIEVTKEMLYDWFKAEPSFDKLKAETENLYDEYSQRARNFYKAFFCQSLKREVMLFKK